MKTVGLIQAHYRGWGGAADFSLALIDGRYAIEEVITRLRAMKEISAIVIAVPDDPGNQVFCDIADRHGVSCFFGSSENVLARCAGALDSVEGDIAVHVMGQHCFIDAALLSEMLAFLDARQVDYVSLPDDFTPYFAGKIYRRAIMDRVAPVIEAMGADRDIHLRASRPL